MKILIATDHAGLELKNNNPSLWDRLQLLMDHDADSKVETEYNDDDVFKVRDSHAALYT